MHFPVPNLTGDQKTRVVVITSRRKKEIKKIGNFVSFYSLTLSGVDEKKQYKSESVKNFYIFDILDGVESKEVGE